MSCIRDTFCVFAFRAVAAPYGPHSPFIPLLTRLALPVPGLWAAYQACASACAPAQNSRAATRTRRAACPSSLLTCELPGSPVTVLFGDIHVIAADCMDPPRPCCRCRLAVSTRSADYVVDALALRSHVGPALAPIMHDPSIVKVLHGADRDVEWLQVWGGKVWGCRCGGLAPTMDGPSVVKVLHGADCDVEWLQVWGGEEECPRFSAFFTDA
eukprot:353162-Chlamydomonas_euryale.AAC.2